MRRNPLLSQTLFCAAALIMLVSAARGAVGYYNRQVGANVNLIANQLNATPNNNINNILINPGIPDGAVFTKWSNASSSYLPFSYFDGSIQQWSVNYSLNLREGGCLYLPGPLSPQNFSITFVGEVATYPPVGTTVWAPNYAPGLHLISCPIPYSVPLSTLFQYVVGRAPDPGESVWILNESTQLYTESIYNGTWDVDASLRVGQAAWFDIGGTGATPPILVIPEPASFSLAAVAGILLVVRRKFFSTSVV